MPFLDALDAGFYRIEGDNHRRQVPAPGGARGFALVEESGDQDLFGVNRGTRSPTASAAGVVRARDPEVERSKLRAELRAKLAWHQQSLKAFDEQNGILYKTEKSTGSGTPTSRDAGTIGQENALKALEAIEQQNGVADKKDISTAAMVDVGPVRRQLEELLPLAQQRDASGFNATPEAKEAREKYTALKTNYDALRQKRQRILDATARVQAEHDSFEKHYGAARFGAAFDEPAEDPRANVVASEPAQAPAPPPAAFALPTGDDWVSQRIRAINQQRQARGERGLNPAQVR